MPTRSLHKRLMLAFAGFTLVTAGVFGFYAIVFMYAIEDASFEAMLEQEAGYQLRQLDTRGRWGEPREAWVSVHADPSTFPADLKRTFDAEPWRTEFAGQDARHYHVRAIVPPAPAAPAWLVAEVGSHLVVRPMRNQVLMLLACTGVLIIALALLVGHWIARRTSGPLARLAGRIETMSPLQLPVGFAHEYPDDEVGVVARGLEGLVGRVQAFVTREQEFTRDASHELRTPLAVILGATERLMTEPRLSDDGRRHLAHVRQSVLQLEQTVATLLALARELPVASETAPVALLPVLERVIVEQSPLLEGREDVVEVIVDVPADAEVALPAAVLHILLSNLVGNAFAHAAAGEVRIDAADGRLRIANSGDAGDPAARWRQPQAFSKRDGSSGLGLGLAIVHRLCERHRIDLRIEDAQGRVMASIPVDNGHA